MLYFIELLTSIIFVNTQVVSQLSSGIATRCLICATRDRGYIKSVLISYIYTHIYMHTHTHTYTQTRVYPKVSGLSHNEVNNNKHSLRSNTKGYGGKTH
jgi:hypothetical protein